MFSLRGLSPITLARLSRLRWREPEQPLHVFLCIADHFEPKWQRPPASVARQRVLRWAEEYPALAARYHDCLGRTPKHTFFYPAEEYEPELLDPLAQLHRSGYGDVEIHLHHDNDSSDNLRETLERFTSLLHVSHGLLQKDSHGRLSYGFIHGNWALDNSRPDGRWCGVSDEITVLRQTGCYADFTMPSAPAGCQTATVNSIYYAVDDPHRPKSHDRGAAAAARQEPPDESLLLIQGPLALDWSRRKFGFMPGIENGDLTARRPPTLERLWNWLAAGVRVQGKDDWLFVKLHTHGAQESNANMLLGEPMHAFHRDLHNASQRHDWLRYYYVTARELAELVHALEDSPDIAVSDVLRPERREIKRAPQPRSVAALVR